MQRSQQLSGSVTVAAVACYRHRYNKHVTAGLPNRLEIAGAAEPPSLTKTLHRRLLASAGRV